MNIIESIQNELDVLEDQIKEVRDSIKTAQHTIDRNTLTLRNIQRQRIELKETLDNYLNDFNKAVDKLV